MGPESTTALEQAANHSSLFHIHPFIESMPTVYKCFIELQAL